MCWLVRLSLTSKGPEALVTSSRHSACRVQKRRTECPRAGGEGRKHILKGEDAMLRRLGIAVLSLAKLVASVSQHNNVID